MSRPLTLYTTLGCTLCEKAKAEIWPLLSPHGLRLREVDIADDPILMERFATQIPLVGLGDPDDVCAWPFDRHRLEEWLLARL